MSDFSANRRAMIDSQLRTSGVTAPAVIAAMGTVPRENYVPAAFRAIAYMDRSVTIAAGRVLNPPLSTGLMLQEANVTAGDRVLLIGVGTGYLAALLCGKCAALTAIEESAELMAKAQINLASQENLTLIAQPLTHGAAEHTPYSLVLIDGAIETLPQHITDQIDEGGRIVTGVADGAARRMASGYKRGGKIALRAFADTEIAALTGFAHAKEFVF
jgi:protein-L-isoaspartate(D-aspartate) O-methyltransferase